MIEQAVVGGGMLGSVLALRLAEQGHRVTLIEAADHLGGVADSWVLEPEAAGAAPVRWDRHYHVICRSDTALRRLLAQLGLDREIRWRSTSTGFWDGHRLAPISSNRQILRNLPLGWLDKARLGLTVLQASLRHDRRRLEQIPVLDWLRRWSGERVVERLWLPLLRAKLGSNAERVSAAFLWAVIQRLAKARRQGLGAEQFGHVPGGYARILERLSEELERSGVRIRLGTRVETIGPPGAGGPVVVLPGGEEARFERVAVTTPAAVAARLCPGLTSGELERLRAVEYQGIVCASLLLDRPLAGHYLLYATDPSLPFSTVVEMSSLVDPEEAFGGRHLVYLPRYVSADDPLFETPEPELRERFLSGLESVYPSFDRGQVAAFRVSRVRHLLALPTLGYSERLPPRETSIPGLSIVCSAHIVDGTLNVDETLKLAEAAARAAGTNGGGGGADDGEAAA